MSWAKASVNPFRCSEWVLSPPLLRRVPKSANRRPSIFMLSTPAWPVTRLGWRSEKLMTTQGFPIVSWSTVSSKERDLALGGDFSPVFTSPLGCRCWVLPWLTPWDVAIQRLTRQTKQVRPCLYSVLPDFSPKCCKKLHTLAALSLPDVAKVINLLFFVPRDRKENSTRFSLLLSLLRSVVKLHCSDPILLFLGVRAERHRLSFD